MRKIKEVLRLKYQHQLSERQIARSCSISRCAVAEYLRRARQAGIEWPLPKEANDADLEAQLFPVAPPTSAERKPPPDFVLIHEQQRRFKHVTLQQLWQEYKQDHPDGYQYSQFCEQYRRRAQKLDLVLRQVHRAGEKLFVDYAGQTVPLVNPHTGETTAASIFVAVWGASNYTFAEASLKQDLPSWIASHIHALEYFGGSPAVLVPDNLRAGVQRACRYEPDINPTYQDLAAHYGIAVIPARPRKPRDKAKVENGVLVVERWILATLRQRTFFSLSELNQAIREQLEKLNHRPFRKRPGSRAELFEQLERPALRPLPGARYAFAEWKWAAVGPDYHVELDRHYYSVPYRLVGRKVEVRYTATTVEVFHRGERMAAHARGAEPEGATTLAEHRPPAHQRCLEWTPARLLEYAAKVGPATAGVVERLLQSSRRPEQGLRSGLGLWRLAERFGSARLEAACARALRFDTASYRSVQLILQRGLDQQPHAAPAAVKPPLVHQNLRGAGYFAEGKEAPYVD